MTKDTIVLVCEAEGLKANADALAIPEERDATFLIGAPGEILTVGKIAKIELRDKYLCLQTAKQERFFFTYDLVLGLRLTPPKPTKDQLGFGR
jgi:hypothetical protein